MITWVSGQNKFNLRTVGIIFDREHKRVLTQGVDTESSVILPGGRVELREPSSEAIKREMREELEVEVNVERLVWLLENFYEYGGHSCHEITFYFLVTLPEGSELYDRNERWYANDGPMRIYFEWVPLDEQVLRGLPLVPAFLAGALLDLPETTQYVVWYDK
jgi:ADP-ribose pyrophosphatase YjhB (NUDIX family)